MHCKSLGHLARTACGGLVPAGTSCHSTIVIGVKLLDLRSWRSVQRSTQARSRLPLSLARRINARSILTTEARRCSTYWSCATSSRPMIPAWCASYMFAAAKASLALVSLCGLRQADSHPSEWLIRWASYGRFNVARTHFSEADKG